LHPSHQYPDPKASVTFLVAGLASTVPHILVRLDVAYDGIQIEENRLQSKTSQIGASPNLQFPR
jgi:hypothetical protein